MYRRIVCIASLLGALGLLFHLALFQKEKVLSLNAMSLVNEIFNLVALHKPVEFTAAASIVLELGHLDLVLDFSHPSCCLSDWLEATESIANLANSLIPVLISLQNGTLLSFLKKVRWAHLHAFDIDIMLKRKFLEHSASEAHHPLLFLFLSVSDDGLVSLPVLISEEGASLAPKPRLSRDTDSSSVVNSCALHLTDSVALEVATDYDLLSEHSRL